jgi:hypothetical protein
VREWLATVTSPGGEVCVRAAADGQVTGMEIAAAAMRMDPDDLGEVLTDTLRAAVMTALAHQAEAAAGPTVALVAGGAQDAEVEAHRRQLRALADAMMEEPTTLASPGGEVAVTIGMDGGVERVTVGDAGIALPPADLAAVLLATLRQTGAWATVVRTDRIEQAAALRQAEEEAERRFRES